MTDIREDYYRLLDHDRDLRALRDMQDTRINAQQYVLYELFGLLEQYAPMWYSEEHHQRLRKVLNPIEDVATAPEWRLVQLAVERVIVDAPIAIAARDELKRRKGVEDAR